MSLKTLDSYALTCDFTGCATDTGTLGEYGAWGDEGSAVDEWRDMEGYSGKLGDYCPEHVIFLDDPTDDDYDDHGSSYIRPMPDTLESRVALANRRIAEVINYATRQALYRLDRNVDESRLAADRRHRAAQVRRAARESQATSLDAAISLIRWAGWDV